MNLKEEARHVTKLHLYSVFETKYFDSNVPNEAKYMTDKNHSLLHLTHLLDIIVGAQLQFEKIHFMSNRMAKKLHSKATHLPLE